MQERQSRPIEVIHLSSHKEITFFLKFQKQFVFTFHKSQRRAQTYWDAAGYQANFWEAICEDLDA